MNGTILVKGGCVLTLGARTQNHPLADVLIEDGRIAEIGLGLRSRGARVVDATDTIVMPGFVDTHRHAWRSLFRNFGDAEGRQAPTPAIPHHEPDDVYAATLIGLLGAVESGTTTVVDWSDVSLDDIYIEAALRAHADAGLRTVFVPATPAWMEGDSTPGRRTIDRMGPRTELAAGSPDVDEIDIEQVETMWSQARSAGLRIHAHVGGLAHTPGTVTALAGRGLLGEDVTLVHCTRLDGAEFDAVAAHRVRVSLAPSSEMAGQLGVPPIQALIDRGIRPGLGVDDERVAPGDMFAQMRATHAIQHATMFDLKLAGKAGLPTLLTTREVIRYATIDGAHAAGLGTVTGSLEVGKHADLIVLRTDRPNIAPVNDPIGAVVWGMDTSNLDWVFVGGEALMEHGTITRDVGRARSLAVEAQHRVTESSGQAEAAGRR